MTPCSFPGLNCCLSHPGEREGGEGRCTFKSALPKPGRRDPLSAHLARGVGPRRQTLTGRYWLTGFGCRFPGGIGPWRLPGPGPRFPTDGAVVAAGPDGRLSPPSLRGGCREWVGGAVRRPLELGWLDLPPSPS